MSTSQTAVLIAVSLFCVLLPLGAMYLIRRKKPSWKAFGVGAATFFLFALVLEGIVNNLILTRTPFGAAAQENILLLALYGGLAAGLFEETGRLVAFRLVLKRQNRLTDALCYGFGHGGIEAVLVCGAAMIANIVLCGMYTRGDALDPLLAQQAEAVLATPASTFLWAGFERLSAFFLHTALSVLVFTAVRKSRYVYYAIAVALHALVDIFAVLANTSLPVFVTELLVALLAALTVLLARHVAQKQLAGPDTSPEEVPYE